MIKLGSISKQIRGITYSKSVAKSEPTDGFKAILRAGNIGASRVIGTDYIFVPENLIKKEQYLKYGDILIAASSGSLSVVGKAAMLETNMDASFGAFCKVLRPNFDVINPRFFRFYFETRSYKNTIMHLAEGANINNLKSEHFNNLEIPLPSKPEQQKIARILDAADDLRQKDQQLVDHYTALGQALFIEMFGDPTTNPMNWEQVTLSSTCNKITDGTHQSPKFINEGIPFLFVSNIVDNQINFKTHKFISLLDYQQLTKNTPIEIGDVLLTSVGSYGNPAIVEDDTLFCFQRHIAHIKPNASKVNSLFLREMLKSQFAKNQFDRLAIGVAQKTLNLKVIKSLELINPPLSLQNQFAERITLIEAQKKQAQASLALSQSLFDSLLHRAFTGALTA